MRKVALTTSDNPFNPLDDFDRWYEFDCENNYLTCELLARIAVTSNNVSDEQNSYAIEDAIDSIVSLHPTLYKKVVKNIE